jgi:hypothetical protein
MNKNRIGGLRWRASGQRTAKPISIKLTGGRSANSSSDEGHESHSPLPERSADLATTIVPELASTRKTAKA